MADSTIRKILLPTDGSAASIRAAELAAEIAGCTGAEVVIINVAYVSGTTQFLTYSVLGSKDLPQELRETGEEVIARTKIPFLTANIPIHTKIIEGYASEAILQEARDGRYDMIVMGSRGAHAGIMRRVVFGLGSVAEKVVRNAPCPVLVARE
jgi:nucleotide-binding universal stress UspA family protein